MFEKKFELLLFSSRYITLLAVFGSLFASVTMFIKGTARVVSTVGIFWGQLIGSHEAVHSSKRLLAMFVAAMDMYLFATVLLIFSTGLYKLFISTIDPASRTPESHPNWLKITTLDELKSSLGKVILMILVVLFFEHSLYIEYQNALDLLYLGIGILLVSGALYLTHAKHKHSI